MVEPLSDEALAELDALETRASAGEWEPGWYCESAPGVVTPGMDSLAWQGIVSEMDAVCSMWPDDDAGLLRPSDNEFICANRNAYPAFRERLRRAEAKNQALAASHAAVETSEHSLSMQVSKLRTERDEMDHAVGTRFGFSKPLDGESRATFWMRVIEGQHEYDTRELLLGLLRKVRPYLDGDPHGTHPVVDPPGDPDEVALAAEIDAALGKERPEGGGTK